MNMTDDEIIKVFENCCNGSLGRCVKCPVKPYGKNTCIDELYKLIFDLINRQKAEIERLQGEIGSLNKAYPCTIDVGNNCLVYAKSLDDYDNLIGDISEQGIKEFAERLKETYESADGQYIDRVMSENIDNLVKEMVGEK